MIILKKSLLFILIIGGVVAGCSNNSFPPDANGNCNGEIKGNINQRTGEKIYHIPGDRYYRYTRAEECFHNTQDAEKAGYHMSRK